LVKVSDKEKLSVLIPLNINLLPSPVELEYLSLPSNYNLSKNYINNHNKLFYPNLWKKNLRHRLISCLPLFVTMVPSFYVGASPMKQILSQLKPTFITLMHSLSIKQKI
jgi:hypothetical protein